MGNAGGILPDKHANGQRPTTASSSDTMDAEENVDSAAGIQAQKEMQIHRGASPVQTKTNMDAKLPCADKDCIEPEEANTTIGKQGKQRRKRNFQTSNTHTIIPPSRFLQSAVSDSTITGSFVVCDQGMRSEFLESAAGFQAQTVVTIYRRAGPVQPNPNMHAELTFADNDVIEDDNTEQRNVNNCNITLLQEVMLNGVESGNPPVYTGMTCLSDGRVVIVDYGNNRCSLYNYYYHYMSDFKLSSGPIGICTVDTDEVAIVLPAEFKVMFLRIGDAIQPSGEIKTRRKCTSVAALNTMELVYAGTTKKESSYYWGVITRDGQEKSCFHIPRGNIKGANVFIALNSSNTLAYISAYNVSTVYCVSLDGVKLFEYKVKKGKQRGFPLAIQLDSHDNVYVVDKHFKIIHWLSPDCKLRGIFKDGIPQQPSAICLQQSSNRFLLLAKDGRDANVCFIYTLMRNQ